MRPTATLYSGRGAELYHAIVQSDTSELREIIQSVRGRKPTILELAAGSGRITRPLLPYAASVTAVDNSQELLAILQTETNGRYAGLKCLLADIMTLELEEKFDVVILGTTSICLFDVLERRLLLAKIRGWMAPGGEFLVSLRVPDLGEAGTLRHQLSEDLAIEESYDRATEKFTSTLIHHSGDGEEPTEYSVSTHHLTEDGLEDELAAAGLAVGTALEVGPQDGSGAPGTYLMFKVRVTNTSVGEEAVSE